jgi:hypothetical protein
MDFKVLEFGMIINMPNITFETHFAQAHSKEHTSLSVNMDFPFDKDEICNWQ